MLEPIDKKIYKVAIYIRLSKEDVDRGYDESESIKNQSVNFKFIITNNFKNKITDKVSNKKAYI